MLADIPFTRRVFARAALGATLANVIEAEAPKTKEPKRPPRVLAVVAHPDDEYHFAVTLYRIVRELGGIADQLVITDGAGGHRYSGFAQRLYGLSFGEDGKGRTLKDVRRAETIASGQIIGIRQHFFLEQSDEGFTLDTADAVGSWDHFSITSVLDSLLETGAYDFVFTLLPSADTHGHHKAVALLVLEAASRLLPENRPVILAAEAATEIEPTRAFQYLENHPSTRVGSRTFSVSRKHPLENDTFVDHRVIANWVISSHKSQGLFQMDAGRHDVERFWQFDEGALDSSARSEELFRQLGSPV